MARLLLWQKRPAVPSRTGVCGTRAPGTILRLHSGSGSMRLEEFDQAYVDALRARNPETERHFAAYFERCLRGKLRGLSKEDAEDVRQETLTRVLGIVHSATGVRTPGALGALVASTCHYALLEHLRKRRHHLSLE